jgi:hypothetical protein
MKFNLKLSPLEDKESNRGCPELLSTSLKLSIDHYEKQEKRAFPEGADFLCFNLLSARASQTAGNDSQCNSMLHPCQPFDKSAAATRSFPILQSRYQHSHDAQLKHISILSFYLTF